MMKNLIFTLILLTASPFLPAAENGGLQVITLKDSSIIRAYVTETAGGYYLIKSPTLGDMKILTSSVISIAPAAPRNANPTGTPKAPVSTPPPAEQSGTSSLQSALSSKVQSFVSSGNGMAVVTQFSQNPDLKAVMADPNLMKAIQSGDASSLMNSPAIKRLMENPQTKSLIQSILGSSAQTSPQ